MNSQTLAVNPNIVVVELTKIISIMNPDHRDRMMKPDKYLNKDINIAEETILTMMLTIQNNRKTTERELEVKAVAEIIMMTTSIINLHKWLSLWSQSKRVRRNQKMMRTT